MNIRSVLLMGICGVLASGGALVAAEIAAKVAPLRITLALSDGSKVIGLPELAALSLQTDYSKMEIPLAKIAAVKFDGGATNAAVTLTNGDKLSAVPGIAELRLTTVFGKVTIPLKMVTGLTVSAGGTDPLLREGLILWFPFDGAPGPEATDASGHGHNGKLVAGARIVADEGRRRDVLELDGRGAHIRVPGSPDFCLTNATFSVWLKPAEWTCRPNAANIMLSTLSRDSFDGWEYFIGGPNLIVWHCRLPDEHKQLNIESPLEFENEADWHFLAVTFVFQDGHYTVTTSCDGKPAHQEIHPASVMGYSGQLMQIGANYDPARGYKGRMDDLMLFDRALSEQDIAALYNAQK